MKLKFLFLCSLFFATSAYTQSLRDSANFRGLLFNHFIEGLVLMKSGEYEKAPLNYNTDDQSVMFIKDMKYMTLTGLEDVDTIYIHDKKFVPIKGVVFEVVTPSEEFPLFVSYTNKVRPVVATVDHNGGSKQASAEVSNTVSDAYTFRSRFNSNYSVEFIRHYLVKKRHSFYKFTNEKQAIKAFPDIELALKKYIFDNNVNFSNPIDMVNLVTFCNEEMRKHANK